jgi:hypothetical protein
MRQLWNYRVLLKQVTTTPSVIFPTNRHNSFILTEHSFIFVLIFGFVLFMFGILACRAVVMQRP